MAKSKNPYIKKANVETEFTTEQIMELKKCAKDPIYFIKNYCYIQHPTKGKVKFKLYDYQEEIIKAYEEHKDVIVLSARQTGKCYFFSTKIDLIKRPKALKKIILRILDKRLYNALYKNM